MHFLYVFSLLSWCFWSSFVNAHIAGRYGDADAVLLSERRSLARRNTTSIAPSCASSCLDKFIPVYCGSSTNLTCICTSYNLTTAVTACAYPRCNVTDLLQFQRYSAQTCGVTNDKSKIDEVLLMDYIVPALTTAFVAGRVFARISLDVGLGADDWVLVSAYITYMIAVATSLGLVLNKFGEHTFWLTTAQVISAMKFFYWTELFYMLSITLTKLSLLLFFLRIFPSQRLLKISWALGIFIVVSNFSILVALAFQCVPFEGYWTNWMYKVNPVKCINQFAALNAAAALGIFHNVAILVLPLPTLWSLNLPWQRKLNLLIMFSVGSFVIICSCLRLPSLAKLQSSNDLSYDQAPIIVFSHLEQGVGLICACLPACRSLVEHFVPSLKMSQISSRSPTNGTAYPGTGSKHAALGTSARSFIELHDRSSMPEMQSTHTRGDSNEGSELTLQEVLAGAPAASNGKGGCNGRKGGCRKQGFGHETRVAGGGKELPESVLVPMSMQKSTSVAKSEEKGRDSNGSRRGSVTESTDGLVTLAGCNGGAEKKGSVIICTKTIEYSHEDI